MSERSERISKQSERVAPFDWLVAHAAEREAAGLRRRVRPRRSDEQVLDLAGNDYLGLARDARVREAAAAAAKEWGAGSTGSRLVTGSTTLHAELEAEAAGVVGAEAGLAFSSGYLANIGAVTALAGPGTLIVSDAGNHASLIDACRLSRATVAISAHRDVGHVERLLAQRSEERAVVITDGVFSVDGDLAPIAELVEVARRHGAGVIVDEAHALGVTGPGGRGSVHAAGLAGAPDVVITAVLSKSLGSQGGLVLGPRQVIEHVVDSARSFIFDTGLSPACAAAGLEALRLLHNDPTLAWRVRDRANDLYNVARAVGLEVTAPQGAVCGIRIGAPELAVAAAEACLDAGVRVGCFRPPSVPDGRSRLRLTARADLTDADLEKARVALCAAAKVIGA